jgi:hypothetical protein
MGGAFAASTAGNLTGEGPKDPDKRRVLEGATDEYGNFVWRPHSIRIVNPMNPKDVKWLDYSNLGHYAVPLAAVANTVENYYENGQVVDGQFAMQTTSDVVKAIANISYLQGLGNIVKLALEGRAGEIPGRLTGDIASRFIPKSGLLREAVGQTDPEIKEPAKFSLTDPGNLQPFVEGAKAQIPGLSEQVPEKVGPFGKPEQRGKELLSAILPITGKGEVDPVRSEVARLNQSLERSGSKEKVGVQFFSSSDLKRKYGAEQTKEQTREYQTEAGQVARIYIDHLVNDPKYGRMSDEAKATNLNKALSVAYELSNLRAGDRVSRDPKHQAVLAWASTPQYEGVGGTPEKIRLQNFEIGKARSKLRDYKLRYGDIGSDILEGEDPRAFMLATEYPRLESEWLKLLEDSIDRKFGGELKKSRELAKPGVGSTTYQETLRQTLGP